MAYSITNIKNIFNLKIQLLTAMSE
jgi:hypothetical protein